MHSRARRSRNSLTEGSSHVLWSADAHPKTSYRPPQAGPEAAQPLRACPNVPGVPSHTNTSHPVHSMSHIVDQAHCVFHCIVWAIRVVWLVQLCRPTPSGGFTAARWQKSAPPRLGVLAASASHGHPRSLLCRVTWHRLVFEKWCTDRQSL